MQDPLFQAKQYRNQIIWLALLQFVLLVGVLLSLCFYMEDGLLINRSAIWEVIGLWGIFLFFALGKIYSAYEGSGPDMVVEWSWAFALALGGAASIHVWILPMPVALVQAGGVCLLFLLVLLVSMMVAGNVKAKRVMFCVVFCLFVLSTFAKWSILDQIIVNGKYRPLQWGDEMWNQLNGVVRFLFSPVKWVFDSLKTPFTLTHEDFGLPSAKLNLEVTRVLQVVGVFMIGVAVIFGDALITKIRSYRQNLYFEMLSEKTGIDLRVILSSAQKQRFLQAPVEKHDDLAIESLKEISARLRETRAALAKTTDHPLTGGDNAIELQLAEICKQLPMSQEVRKED